MDIFSRIFPIFVTFIIIINVIEKIIKFLIGESGESNYKKNGDNKSDSLLNNDWRLQRDKDNNKNSKTEIKEDISGNDELDDSADTKRENYLKINKKGRMADYMDDEASFYENQSSNIKPINDKRKDNDFPDEIKIGENRLFNEKNIKEDILKGIVMKEILDKPRSKKGYKPPYLR